MTPDADMTGPHTAYTTVAVPCAIVDCMVNADGAGIADGAGHHEYGTFVIGAED